MTNEISNGISNAIYKEFGERYGIESESIEQDLQEPCFFIACIDTSIKRYPSNRYLSKNQFCVHYFPETEKVNEECADVAERLQFCLEEICAGGDLVRGTGMESKVDDDVLQFFVDYNFFTRRVPEPEEPMGALEIKENLKG